MMQYVEGRVAQDYNRRKKRRGAFWEDRYHCTIVDSGRYLWNCLKYIDLNMVRAGVVKTPQEWEWCSSGEILGSRKRYRVLDQKLLLTKLGYSGIGELEEMYTRDIEECLRLSKMERESRWTESLAVGGKDFIGSLKNRFRRIRLDVKEVNGAFPGESTWVIKESAASYR